MTLWHQLTCRHACFTGSFVALHMLTFSLTIAFDKSVEAGFQLHCGTHTKQSLTSALLHFISVARAASLQSSPISNLSFPVAIVKLPILECSDFLPHILHLPVHLFPSAPCYLCAPISPLCCIVLPASSSPYHLQWKSNRLILAPAGFPPSPAVMMYIRAIASEQPYQLARS